MNYYNNGAIWEIVNNFDREQEIKDNVVNPPI